MTDKVDEIVLRANELRWPKLEAAIREYGQEMYRQGFLDGEASHTLKQLDERVTVGCSEDSCWHSDGRCLAGCDTEACPV